MKKAELAVLSAPSLVTFEPRRSIQAHVVRVADRPHRQQASTAVSGAAAGDRRLGRTALFPRLGGAVALHVVPLAPTAGQSKQIYKH